MENMKSIVADGINGRLDNAEKEISKFEDKVIETQEQKKTK